MGGVLILLWLECAAGKMQNIGPMYFPAIILLWLILRGFCPNVCSFCRNCCRFRRMFVTIENKYAPIHLPKIRFENGSFIYQRVKVQPIFAAHLQYLMSTKYRPFPRYTPSHQRNNHSVS